MRSVAGFVKRCSRPLGLNRHGFDGKEWIFFAAEVTVSQTTGEQGSPGSALLAVTGAAASS
jgi:hypothetical protein